MENDITFKLNLDSELPGNIKEIAEKQGEHESTKLELIEQLRSLIFQNDECTPHRTDNEYLVKFLRARYWNVKNSYKLLINYYQFRENNRSLYENVPCTDIVSLGMQEFVTVTPYRDQHEHRILIIRFGTWEPSKMPIDDIFKLVMIMIEMGSMEPISQVAGGVGIFDLSGLSMNHVIHLSPSVAQKIIAMIVTSSPLRTSAIHVVNQSWIFNAIINIFKPFLDERMKKKLFIHGSDMKSLHNFIDPNSLPKRYGGIHEDYPYSMWSENLKTNDKIKSELEQLGYNVDSDE